MTTARWIVAVSFMMIGCNAPEYDSTQSSTSAEVKVRPDLSHPPDLAQAGDMAQQPSAAHHCEMLNGVLTGHCIDATCTAVTDRCGDCQAGLASTVYAHADCPGVVVSHFPCTVPPQQCF